jgi:hypothetical protein
MAEDFSKFGQPVPNSAVQGQAPEVPEEQKSQPDFSAFGVADEMPGIVDAALAGAKSGIMGVAKTGEALSGATPEMEQLSPAAQPLEWNDVVSPISELGPKVAYRLAESSPTIAGGIVGATLGAPLGPAGSFTGGTIGSGVGAAAQTLGPIFAQELAANPNDPEGAWERAMKSATTSGAFSAAGWALFPLKFFQGPVKQALFQLAGVQPGLAVTEKAVQNPIFGQDPTEGLGQAYAEGLAVGVVPAIAHQGAKTTINTGAKFFEPKERTLTPEERAAAEAATPVTEMSQSEAQLPDFTKVDTNTYTGDGPNKGQVLPKGEVESVSNVPVQDPSVPPSIPEPGTVRDALIQTGPKEDWQEGFAQAGPTANSVLEQGFRGQRGKPVGFGNNLPDNVKDAAGDVLFPEQATPRMPLQEMRRQIERGEPAYEDNIDTRPGTIDDALEVSSLVRPYMENLKEELTNHLKVQEHLDVIEDAVPRFMYRDGNDRRILTGTDIETDLALQGNLAAEPSFDRINVRSLDPTKITAEVHDLPPVDSPRVKFTVKDAQTIGDYERVRIRYAMGRLDEAQALYGELLDRGAVRVAPSRGASFIYGGNPAKSPIEVTATPSSMRSDHIFYYPSKGGVLVGQDISSASHDALQRPAKGYMSVDWNKVPEDAFISLDPRRIDEIQDPNGLLKGNGKELYQKLLTAFHNDRSNREYMTLIQDAYKDGVYIPFKTPNLVRYAGDSMLMGVKELPKGALVPAYADTGKPARYLVQTERIIRTGEKDRLYIDGSPFSSEQDIYHAQVVYKVIKELQPGFDKMLARLGAENKWYTRVVEGNSDSPGIYVARGEVVFPANFFQRDMMAGDLRAQIIEIMNHELGHAVTLRTWDKLPYNVQSEINNAYFRALLDYEIRQDLSTMETVFKQANYQYHHITKMEWMAEQFRRWTHSHGQVLNGTDEYFKNSAKSIAELQDHFRQLYGDDHVKQKFTSSFAFNKWMDYLEYAARDGKSILQLRQRAAEFEALQYPTPPDLANAWKAAKGAMSEFEKLIANDVTVDVNKNAALGADSLGFGSFDPNNRVLRLMVGSLAWLKNPSEMNAVARQAVAHEAFHSVETALTDSQRSLLIQAAKDGFVLSKADAESYRANARRQFEKSGLTGPDLDAAVQRYVDSEYMAALVDSRANGRSHNTAVDRILDAFILFFERVGNMLRGKGYHTAEDILHSFYRGEITKRFNETAENTRQAMLRVTAEQRMAASGGKMDSIRPDVMARAVEDFNEDTGTPSRDFFFYDTAGKKIARLATVMRDGEPYINMIEVLDRKWWGKDLAKDMLLYAEKIQGVPFRSAQEFTKAGYKMMQRMAPERVKYYVYDDKSDFYYSPKFIWDTMKQYAEIVKTSEPGPSRAMWGESLARWRKLSEQIPAEALNDQGTLSKQWMAREFEISQWQKSRDIEQGKLMLGVMGDSDGKPVEDGYSEISRVKRPELEEANAAKTGYDYGAAPQPEFYMWRKFRDKYGMYDPETRAKLEGSIAPQADRLAKTAKTWFSIRQLAWVNPHIDALRQYVTIRDLQSQRAMEWISRAEDRMRSWENLAPKQRDGLSDLLYWASDMKYRDNAEVAANIQRQPTIAEIHTKAKLLGLNPEAELMYWKIQKDFEDFLTAQEKVFTAQIMRRNKSVQAQQAALAKLKADMNILRSRPDFPMMRFGQYTITGRDPQTGEVTWFSAYDTPKDRDADIGRVSKKLGGTHDIQVGKVPETAAEFMGMPKMMLDRIIADLGKSANGTNTLDATQMDWIGRFAKMHVSDPGARKRSLERKNTPGYSLDAARSYAYYFRNSSRYLARLEFKDAVMDQIIALEKSITGDPMLGIRPAMDGTRRQTIVDTVKEHADFMDRPGKEWITLKALTTHFQLGFSFAAMFTNLTQVPVVGVPYLTTLFGAKAVNRLMADMVKAGKRTWDFTGKNADPKFLQAREEIIRQGKISTGQAAELGSFAESDRFNSTKMGTKAQKFWRDFSYASMFLFQKAERFNREWIFKSAFDLAKADPTNKHVTDITNARMSEVTDMMARTGMDYDTAAATIVAREAIDRTQGVYEQWDRPKFLRPHKGPTGQVLPAMQIFFSFVQQTMFQLFHNPGRMKMLMFMGALYGMSGLPASEDIDNAIRLLARKMFGKDFSLHKFTREKMKEITEGTIFSEVGPDLLLNGISRYSFGAGLLPDGFGAPQFDASSSGSMGQLVPGLSPLLRNLSNSGTDKNAWKNTTAEVLKDMAGPGLGQFFTVLQWMTAPPYSTDQKKWEALLPRAFKGAAKAYRYATEGQETSSTGAVIAKFDWNDPDDRFTIITQALGFTPRVLSEGYEKFEEFTNQKAFYDARKLDVLIQFDKMVQTGDKDMRADAIKGLQQFNTEMRMEGHPELQLSLQNVMQSLKARARARAMSSSGLPSQKSLIPMKREVDKLWPQEVQQDPSVIDFRKVK